MEAPNSPPLSFDMFKALSADAARPLYDALQTTSEQNVRFVLSTTREHASRVREGAISQPSAGLVELAVRTRKSLEPLVQAAAELDDLLRELRGAERATGPRTPQEEEPRAVRAEPNGPSTPREGPPAPDAEGNAAVAAPRSSGARPQEAEPPGHGLGPAGGARVPRHS